MTTSLFLTLAHPSSQEARRLLGALAPLVGLHILTIDARTTLNVFTRQVVIFAAIVFNSCVRW